MHPGGDLGKVSFFPQRFVWIHVGDPIAASHDVVESARRVGREGLSQLFGLRSISFYLAWPESVNAVFGEHGLLARRSAQVAPNLCERDV